MSDFVYILIVSTLMWFHQVATSYELETQQHLAMVDDNMAEVWVASEQLTTRLKQCEKRKKR